MKHLGTENLETERLLLRKNQEQDFLAAINILKDDDIRRWYANCRMGENTERDLYFLNKQLENYRNLDFYRWSIIKKEDNKFLGMISIVDKEGHDDIKDIGWYITREEQGKGYAYEAAREVLRYLFEKVELNGIETCAAIHNPASFKLMEKLGMIRRSNELKFYKYYYGGDALVYEYGITIDEYRKQINERKQKLTK
jgi:[ribosomal protein S5]-alanine N-acetyltransferase